MSFKKKAVFNWSGGKDSALALLKTLEEQEFEVVSLLTTIQADTQTSSIHSIPLELLQKQAKSIGIPLYIVALSKDTKTDEQGMLEAVHYFKEKGVSHFIFGDIFLSDVKTYRESKLLPLGIQVVEPLWGKTSKDIMNEFLQSGIKTRVIVTQADKLDKTFINKDIDNHFVLSLPKEVDICGENGEYHTFSYDGKLFKETIDFTVKNIHKISYEFKMDTGEMKTFYYWQAELCSL